MTIDGDSPEDYSSRTSYPVGDVAGGEMNPLGQPIGPALPDWVPPSFPEWQEMKGRYCRLEPLDVDRHFEGLFEAFAADTRGRNWTYLPYGPFASRDEFRAWLMAWAGRRDPQFYSVLLSGSPQPVGLAAYLRIAPEVGSIEVGHLHFAESLKRSSAATEAMWLMMRNAFEKGYRRYEWKCDACNAASRAAAQRLGFSFEGIFRQASVYKGRSRDTAWFSVVDSEWPVLNGVFTRWLDPTNFDEAGCQITSLRELTRPLLQAADR